MSRVSAPRGTRPTGAGAFRDRAVMERRRRLKRGLIGLLFLVLVVAVVWAVAFSNLLVVRDVSVAGADERDEAAVREVAAEEIGTPLVRVDGQSVAGHITSEVVGVKSAEIDRSLTGTLKVNVTSRVPVLAVRKEGGGYRLLDLGGVAFREVDSPPKGLPTVTPQSGAHVSKHGVRAAQGMVQAFPERDRKQIEDITVNPADQITFELDGTRIVWGEGERADLKVEVISILRKKGPAVIDVSAPEAPVTKDE